MKVLPILYQTEMVRAIVREAEKPGAGKTMTRRLLVPNRVRFFDGRGSAWRPSDEQLAHALTDVRDVRRIDGDTWTWQGKAYPYQEPATHTTWFAHISPAPGDLLWVREAWRVSQTHDYMKPAELPPRRMTMLYVAGGSMGGVSSPPRVGDRPAAEYLHDAAYPQGVPSWAGRRRPGMFLPRWASRLTLEVVDVRIERLQDISDGDALAEGIEKDHAVGMPKVWGWRDYLRGDEIAKRHYADPRESFRTLWSSINGSSSWEANPWVMVIVFKPHLTNVDVFIGEGAR